VISKKQLIINHLKDKKVVPPTNAAGCQASLFPQDLPQNSVEDQLTVQPGQHLFELPYSFW
jgi:hypothetical protein